MVGNNFFKNTYIVGEGRKNYLDAKKYIEDPLFTSFTFDIDYITSPLFYTINGDLYGYPDVDEGNIGTKLEEMYNKFLKDDQGYDILPVMSAEFLDNGDKLGFGLQKNVYMDRPLYGATEYIYMVDKRNSGFDQSDVRYSDIGDNANLSNSYKLGDSVKEIVSGGDVAWAEKQIAANEETIKKCEETMGSEENPTKAWKEHQENLAALKAPQSDFFDYKETVKGLDGEYSESEIMSMLSEYNKKVTTFDAFRQEVVDWVNGRILTAQGEATRAYKENACMKTIVSYGDDLTGSTKESYAKKLKTQYGGNFRQDHLYYGKKSFEVRMRGVYNTFITNDGSLEYEQSSTDKGWTKAWAGSKNDDGESFLINRKQGDEQFTVREKYIKEQFNKQLEFYGLLEKNWIGTGGLLKGEVKVSRGNTNIPNWSQIYEDKVIYFTGYQHDYDENGDVYKLSSSDKMIKELMSLKCDVDTAFTDSFSSNIIKENQTMYENLQQALADIQFELYGTGTLDENGNEYGSYNPAPESRYGLYLAAKEKCDNDEFSQSQKAKSLAEAGVNNLNSQLEEYGKTTDDEGNIIPTKIPMFSEEVKKTSTAIAPQTVLDMLGFISGMKKMTKNYPYIIQGITGLDTAYNNHYGIKDPYMGSGDDKITLTCLESLSLRVSSMFNRYFNAVYDRQYRRERVPVNLRRFNCSIYVHDVRNFVSKMGENSIENRIIELRDMYYGVIEFKFYDCEIVPEETGNIFNDISNEAPTEMKKTNFTFTYGNCVVNFVPNNLIERYENEIGELPKIELSESITSATKAVSLNPQTGFAGLFKKSGL